MHTSVIYVLYNFIAKEKKQMQLFFEDRVDFFFLNYGAKVILTRSPKEVSFGFLAVPRKANT